MADEIDRLIKRFVAAAGGNYHDAMRIALIEMAKLQKLSWDMSSSTHSRFDRPLAVFGDSV